MTDDNDDGQRPRRRRRRRRRTTDENDDDDRRERRSKPNPSTSTPGRHFGRAGPSSPQCWSSSAKCSCYPFGRLFEGKPNFEVLIRPTERRVEPRISFPVGEPSRPSLWVDFGGKLRPHLEGGRPNLDKARPSLAQTWPNLAYAPKHGGSHPRSRSLGWTRGGACNRKEGGPHRPSRKFESADKFPERSVRRERGNKRS